METVVLILHLFVAAGLIFLVLIQRSEGGALGMGGGGSNAMMSSRGAAGALVRMTTGLGVVFFCTSLALSWLGGSEQRRLQESIDLSEVAAPASTATPTSALPSDLGEAPPEGDANPVSSPAQAAPLTAPTAPAPASSNTRAGPITSGPAQPATTQRASTPAPQRTTSPARTTPASSSVQPASPSRVEPTPLPAPAESSQTTPPAPATPPGLAGPDQ